MEPKLEIIAERALTFTPDGDERSVTVEIGRPYKDLDGAHFCPYRIKGLGQETPRRAGGVDSIQAIQLALVMIGAELSFLSQSKDQSLKWNGSTALGFPKSIRDSVAGEPED